MSADREQARRANEAGWNTPFVKQPDAPFFVIVTTRSIDNPDEPPRRDTINYNSQSARKWLASHSRWALFTNHSVMTAPTQPGDM